MTGTVRQFEIFVAVCEQKSISSAARRLDVSQAAVSRQIAALERRVGIKLFDRCPGKSSALSVQGEAMLKHAMDMLRLAGTMRDVARPDVAIRIGADHMIANLAIRGLFDASRGGPLLGKVELVEIEPGLDPAAELEALNLDLLYFTVGPAELVPDNARRIATAESGLFISPGLWRNLAAEASLPVILPRGNPRIAAGIQAVLAMRLAGQHHVAAEVEPGSALELLLTGIGAGVMNRKRAARLVDAGLLMEVSTFKGPFVVARYEMRREPTKPGIEKASSVLSAAIKAVFA